MKNKKTVFSAFCGTGKSYLCFNNPSKFMEFECWKYDEGNFPENYIKDIKKGLDKFETVFVSTNPVVLKKIHQDGIEVVLFYPRNNLKSEYLKRFVKRGSSNEFIEMLTINWDKWIDELKEQTYCKQIILNSGEYISKYLKQTKS